MRNDLGFSYHAMNGNAGLSKAYNAALGAIDSCRAVVLLDDDTELPPEYFKVLETELENNPEIDIFAPIVVGQDGTVWSPNNASFMRNHLLASPDDSPAQDRFNAIASCLAVRWRVFKDYKFDESLFVDQIDQNFFDDMRARGKKFLKLDVIVHQNFYQRGALLTPKAGWSRLRLRIVDLMRYARLKDSVKYVVLGYAKCCGLGLQIARKTGSPAVFLHAVSLATSCLVRPR